MCREPGCRRGVSARGLCAEHYQRPAAPTTSSPGVDDVTLQRFKRTAGTGPSEVRAVRILRVYSIVWFRHPYKGKAVPPEDREAVRAAVEDNERYRQERNLVSGF